MHRILCRAVVGDHSVPGFVVGGQALFLVADDMAALFGTHDHLDGGFLDFGHGDGVEALAGGQEGRFVEQVFEIGRR